MLCIEIASPGEPDQLVPVTRSIPTPSTGQVLVKVAAAGVNRPDIVQREGRYPPPPGASDIPGLEIAGEIVAMGEGVIGLAVGDRVMALVTGGGYAEYCLAEAALCLPWPTGYDALQAAAVPETFFTVWHNVFQRCGLKAGETFLVHGGASGIGTAAIQLAKAFGARVFATCSGEAKVKACRDLGADLAIDYSREDWQIIVKDKTDGRGVDVILDMVGGEYIAKNIASLALDGRLAMIAFMRGAKAEINFMPVMLKRLTLTGSTLRAQNSAAKQSIAQDLYEKVWPLLNQGAIAPLIHARFPLRQACDAHRLMESNRHIGKIMLFHE